MYKINGFKLMPLIVLCLIFALPVLLNYSRVKSDNTVDGQFSVKLQQGDSGSSLFLNDYLVGVIAGEMPAAYHPEALKAQAIAARTYALFKLTNDQEQKHPGRLCDDPRHCQEYITMAEMKQRWGNSYQPYLQKIKQVISDTDGLVITVQGQLVEPVYHASCGGLGTEDASEVWSNNKSYLKGVRCPEAEGVVIDKHTVTLTMEEVRNSLNKVIPVAARATRNDRARTKIAVLDKTPSGRVKSIMLGNNKVKATEFRQALGLRSTGFSITELTNKDDKDNKGDKKEVIITTVGYGHGVGLCQVGSNIMAQQGKDYRYILSHYYQEIKISEAKVLLKSSKK